MGPALIPDEARKLIQSATIQSEAGNIAREYNLDPDRVQSILERTAVDLCGIPLFGEGGGSLKPISDLAFVPSLRTALTHLPPENAVSLFENEDSTRLRQLEIFGAYLNHPGVPYHSLHELETLMDAFIRHLDFNKEHLIATGFPHTRFDRSKWLDRRLGKLYFVKLPIDVRSTVDRGTVAYEYSWTNVPAKKIDPPNHSQGDLLEEKRRTPREPAVWWPDVAYGFDDAGSLEAASYEDAPFLDCLDTADIVRLESRRRQFLDVKVAILKCLVSGLRAEDPHRLWQDCLNCFVDALKQEEALFLLDFDRSYFYAPNCVPSPGLIEVLEREGQFEGFAYLPYWSGGLKCLFELIGHCEKELSLRTMDRTRKALSVIEGRLSYYNAVRQHKGSIFHTALNMLIESESDEKDFWQTYVSRVHRALNEKFWCPVHTEVWVEAQYARILRPIMHSFGEFQKAHIEATGMIAPFPGSSVGIPDTRSLPDQNAFKRQGQGWRIEYDGTAIGLRDSKGLRYIGFLLQNPGGETHCSVLRSLDLADLALSSKGISDESRDQRSTSDIGGEGKEILDPTAGTDYQQRLRELREERAEAAERNDQGRIEKIDEEVGFIEGELNRCTGLGGRDRKLADENETARKSVGRSITRALEEIRALNPSLERFLSSSIKTGLFCSYNPTVPVSWSF